MTYSSVLHHIMRCTRGILPIALVMGLAHLSSAQVISKAHRDEHLGGYLIIPHTGNVGRQYNAGYSMYVAAWPLLSYYPGHRFQAPGCLLSTTEPLPKTCTRMSKADSGGGPTRAFPRPHRNSSWVVWGRTSPLSLMGRRTDGAPGNSHEDSTGWRNSVRGSCFLWTA